MIQLLNDLLWNALVFVLIGLGTWFTLSTRFIQFRHFGRMFRVLIRGRSSSGGVSSYQALVLSIGGRVGSGNIAGVAVAISLGGPGAVFWMWLIALLGMVTSIVECTLAQLYKRREDGEFRGGPAFYIEHGLGTNWKWLAVLFSALLFITFGVAFVALQSYAIAASFDESFGTPTIVTGCIVAAAIGLIIFGGIRRLVHVAELVVPAMAIGYIICALYIIAINLSDVPETLLLIVRSAFGLEETLAGGIGAALSWGVKRGLFSNEAGLGSAPNVAATAEVDHPVEQGIAQALSVFIDTIILCSCTALIILLSGTYVPGSELGGITLTQQALDAHMGVYAGWFVSIALFFFSFTSIMYNYYLGENALNYLFKHRLSVFTAFRWLTIALIVWGSLQNLETIFSFADLTMGLLAVVNLFALAMLFRQGQRSLRDYDSQLADGKKTPRLDKAKYSDLNLDPEAW